MAAGTSIFQKGKSSYFPDIQIFLFIIPFAAAVNYYLTYVNIRFNWFLLLTFTIDTVQGYLAWLAVRRFIIYLDHKMPYAQGTLRRIAVQITVTLFIGLFIIASTTEIVSLIAKGKPAPLNFYTVDLVIISIWFFVINGIYILLHYYNQWRLLEAWRREEKKKQTGGLVVKQGKQDIQLRFADIDGLYVDGEYVMACSRDGKKFFLDQSLDKLEKQLPEAGFFRLNRQYIVHQHLVKGFKRAEQGKILVLLQPGRGLPEEIPVSRTKAPAFKSWFRPS
jgi:DNA-binding LytR/AlgR family response regulator